MLPAEQPSEPAAPWHQNHQALQSLSAPTWMGQYAIPAQDFNPASVGAKSMNLSHLQVIHTNPCISGELWLCPTDVQMAASNL